MSRLANFYSKTAVVIGAIIALPYFLLAIISVIGYLSTNFATESWWEHFSLTADIFGLMAICYSFLLWIAGYQTLAYEDVVAASRKGVIDSPAFQELFRIVRNISDDELPEAPDSVFTERRLIDTALALENIGFSQASQEFSAVNRLLANDFVTDAIIRSRRAMEITLRQALNRIGMSTKRPSGLHMMIRQLKGTNLLEPEETLVVKDFSQMANRVVHGDYAPNHEDAIALILATAEITVILVRRIQG